MVMAYLTRCCVASPDLLPRTKQWSRGVAVVSPPKFIIAIIFKLLLIIAKPVASPSAMPFRPRVHAPASSKSTDAHTRCVWYFLCRLPNVASSTPVIVLVLLTA
jgi:hypothetical protein